jgi:hypothetical protein
MEISRIEIDFAVPVKLSDEDQKTLFMLAGKLARANAPEGCVHWASGCGSKPQFSRADGRFLGKEVADDAPEDGEPTWDDTVFHIETCCRERYENEKE